MIHTDLVYALWSEFIRKSMHAGFYTFLHVAVTVCATLVNIQTGTQTFNLYHLGWHVTAQRWGLQWAQCTKTHRHTDSFGPAILLAQPCLLVSFLTAEGRRSLRAPTVSILSVPCQPWTLCHCSVWPVLDVICPSSPRPALSSLSISVHMFLAPITWPKYQSLRRCTVVSRRSCGCTSCSTNALVWGCHLKTSHLSFVHSLLY